VANNATDFSQIFAHSDFTYGGLMVILGLKGKLSDQWDVGLSVRPYSFRLHGSGEDDRSTATQAEASGSNPSTVLLDGLKVNLPVPMKVTGGGELFIPVLDLP